MSDEKETIQLTNKEKEVLSLIVKGGTTYAISVDLNISENTVLTHTKNIYRKLGVNNRQLAVAMAIKLNLIDF